MFPSEDFLEGEGTAFSKSGGLFSGSGTMFDEDGEEAKRSEDTLTKSGELYTIASFLYK